MGSLKKRSVNLAGHATSLALEPEFWSVLEVSAVQDGLSLAGLIQSIDTGRGERALASACRVFALHRASALHVGRGETTSSMSSDSGVDQDKTTPETDAARPNG